MFRRSLLVLTLMMFVMAGSLVAAQDTPVKLAVFGPFTGPAASIGQEQLNWARLAVDDFNEATGWNVELVEADTQLDPAVAVTVAEAILADPEVLGAVGPAGSQEVEAIGQMFVDSGLVHVSSSATRPSLTASGFNTFFRVVPTDAAQGPTDARFIYNELGATQLFIIDDQSSYAVGLADEVEATFTELGGTVVGRESVTQDDTDFSSLVTLAASSGAEVVFFPGQIASQGALFARQLVEQGSDIILFGADGFQSVEDFIVGAAGASEGAYVSAFAPDISGIETSADVIARYTEQYGEFGTFGPPTYAAALVVLEAMQRASEAGNLTREGVLAEVANTNQEMSVLGNPLAFDENGDVLNASFYIFQVQDGAFVLIPPTVEEGEMATPEATEEG